jgi:hypothetical protein
MSETGRIHTDCIVKGKWNMASLWKFAVASSANQDKKTSASEVEAARNEKQRAKTISNKRDGENVSEPKRLAHADRYQHDLNQAIAMRGGDSHLRASTNNLSSFKAESLSKDIELGYIGLDEADAFRIAGKRKESLKLYELCLELLIRVLKTLRAERGVDCDTKLDPEINPIESRVKAALSDAERVKAMLESNENGLGAPQNFRQSPSPEPKCLPPSPESNSLVSLSSAADEKAAFVVGGQAARHQGFWVHRRTFSNNSFGLPR